MLASRLEIAEAIPGSSFLPWRSCAVGFRGANLSIAAAYVPSRDTSPEKTERKRRYLTEFYWWLKDQVGLQECIVIGDLNVLERAHVPRYSMFQEWEYVVFDMLAQQGLSDAFRLQSPSTTEYSWVAPNGDGYRFDHCFVPSGYAQRVVSCSYVHETRERRLSDHSALVLEIEVPYALPERPVRHMTVRQPSLFALADDVPGQGRLQ